MVGLSNLLNTFRRFSEAGHEVFVYNSHLHPYQEKSWNGVNLVHCYDPEEKIGTIGQFIYDFNCILDSQKRSFDIILQLGYTSSSIWIWLFQKMYQLLPIWMVLSGSAVNTASQFSFFKFAEKLAVFLVIN